MKSWHSLLGYTRRDDGTFAKTVTFGWGVTKKHTATETLVRSRSGRLLRVERSARAIALSKAHARHCDTTPKERLPYKKRPATTS